MPPDGESSDDVKQSIRMTADRILAMPTKELGERKSRAGIVIPATAACVSSSASGAGTPSQAAPPWP